MSLAQVFHLFTIHTHARLRKHRSFPFRHIHDEMDQWSNPRGDTLMVTYMYISDLILMLGFDLSKFLLIDIFITSSQESSWLTQITIYMYIHDLISWCLWFNLSEFSLILLLLAPKSRSDILFCGLCFKLTTSFLVILLWIWIHNIISKCYLWFI